MPEALIIPFPYSLSALSEEQTLRKDFINRPKLAVYLNVRKAAHLWSIIIIKYSQKCKMGGNGLEPLTSAMICKWFSIERLLQLIFSVLISYEYMAILSYYNFIGLYRLI